MATFILARILDEIAEDPAVAAAMDRFCHATKSSTPIEFSEFQQWLEKHEPDTETLLKATGDRIRAKWKNPS